jgi:hypothetical protein
MQMDAYKKLIWASIIIVIVLIIPMFVYFFFIKNDAPPYSPPPLPSKSETQSSVPPVKEIIKKEEPLETLTLNIELNNSDETLREWLRNCSSHPGFLEWLKNSDMIRRFVAVVENIATGASPAPHLEFLLPSGKFKVFKRSENIFIDPASYKRYNSTAAILASLDSRKLVKIYRQVKPLMEEAYKELGYPEKEFGETLLQAFSVLLNTPIPGGDILLEEKVMVYAFEDPGLEHLSAAQKHLIRMGPNNAEKIKAKLREILKEIRGK